MNGGGGFHWLFWMAVVVTVGVTSGLVASALVVSRAYQSRYEISEKREQTIQVTGSGRKRIRSDLAVWEIGVSADGKDLAAAYKGLKESSERIEKFLEANHFKPAEVSEGAISTDTHYKQMNLGSGLDSKWIQTQVAESYTLRRTYRITTSRADEVEKPASEITELIQDGIKVVSSPPNYYYTKIGELKVEMLGEASKDARLRADQIVSNAGCAITEVRYARMGVLQITKPNSTEVSDSGIYDTTTIEKDVTAVVGLTLGLR